MCLSVNHLKLFYFYKNIKAIACYTKQIHHTPHYSFRTGYNVALCDTELLLESLIPYVLFFEFLFVAERTTTTARTCLTDMGHKDTHETLLLLYTRIYTLLANTHKVHPDGDTHGRADGRTHTRTHYRP